MTSAIFSVLLFGFVHPGSKLILNSGLNLFHFCFLYLGFRLVIQLPVVIYKKHYLIPSKKHLSLLVGMGFIGAALQWTEFKGITDGLSVAVVTFLIYSYPLWATVFSIMINKETVSGENIFKVALSSLGMLLIVGSQLSEFKFNYALVFPLVASVLMALWVCLSNLAKKSGCSSWSISFYYDAFAFITIAVLAFTNGNSSQISQMHNWFVSGTNSLVIIGYAVLFGVLPNLLFYKASQNLSAMNLGLLLLFEPVISSVSSYYLWNETLNERFVVGGLFILASNISFKYFFQLNFFKLKKESL